MSERILVVEDETSIAEAVGYALREAGYAVDTVGDGRSALDAARELRHDLMVLDLMLPDISGLDVCREVRGDGALPIIILTARDSAVDRVLGLEIGADDYVTKPFSVAELVSRVRALLRRRELDGGQIAQRIGDLELDVARHESTLKGRPVQLTRSEFRVVALLASEPGRVFTRDELCAHLWEGALEGDRRAIDVHMSNLRRKLEDDPRNPKRLRTARGIGYCLVP